MANYLQKVKVLYETPTVFTGSDLKDGVPPYVQRKWDIFANFCVSKTHNDFFSKQLADFSAHWFGKHTNY